VIAAINSKRLGKSSGQITRLYINKILTSYAVWAALFCVWQRLSTPDAVVALPRICADIQRLMAGKRVQGAKKQIPCQGHNGLNCLFYGVNALRQNAGICRREGKIIDHDYYE
jgi:hypothetical protein